MDKLRNLLSARRTLTKNLFSYKEMVDEGTEEEELNELETKEPVLQKPINEILKKWPIVAGKKTKPLLINTTWMFNVFATLLVPVYEPAGANVLTKVYVDQVNKLFAFQVHGFEDVSSGCKIKGNHSYYDQDPDEGGKNKAKKKYLFQRLDYIQSLAGHKIGWCLVVRFSQLAKLTIRTQKLTFHLKKKNETGDKKKSKKGKIAFGKQKLNQIGWRKGVRGRGSVKLPGSKCYQKIQPATKGANHVGNWREDHENQFEMIDVDGGLTNFLIGRQKNLPKLKVFGDEPKVMAISRLIEVVKCDFPKVVLAKKFGHQAAWSTIVPDYEMDIKNNYYYYLESLREQLRACGISWMELSKMDDLEVIGLWLQQRKLEKPKRQTTPARVIKPLRKAIKSMHKFIRRFH